MDPKRQRVAILRGQGRAVATASSVRPTGKGAKTGRREVTAQGQLDADELMQRAGRFLRARNRIRASR